MRMKRWISVLLALSMTLTQLPLAVLADGEIPENTEALYEEIPEVVEEADEEISDENTEEPVLEQEFFMEGVPSVEVPDNDELYNGYAYQQLYGEIATYGTLARAHLTEKEQGLYDHLKDMIENIAANGQGGTSFVINATTLKKMGIKTTFPVGADFNYAGELFSQEFNMNKVVDALLADCPYDLYWFDKVSGWRGGFNMSSDGSNVFITKYTIELLVAQNYQGANNLSVSSGVAAITTAVETAQSIVDRHATKSDYEKLLAYKNEICSMVDYNHAAANGGNFSADDDPWQLIYVFDGDSSTKTVCEGYSKAMQYLCDMSSFNGNVYCYSVSGAMNGGAHMWNIVEIKGRNYLLDVTNSDSGTIGQNGELFLAGGSGSVYSGYNISGTRFTYGNETISLWGEEALTLSSTKYVDSGDDSVSIKNAVVTVNPVEMTYTGEELIPEVIVKVNGVTLTEGKDYTLTFSSNVEVGTASVLVTGKGSYTGNVTAEFEIIPAGFSGECGDNAVWSLEDGVLTISGSGSIDYCGWSDYMYDITRVIIEEGITEIGDRVFENHSILKSIELPESLTAIRYGICRGCLYLNDVYYAGSFVDWAELDVDRSNSNIFAATMHYGKSTAETASGSCGRNAVWTLKENGTLTISGSGAIYDYDFSDNVSPWYNKFHGMIKKVVVEEGITDLGAYAFYYCDNLASVQLPEGLLSLGDHSFFGCEYMSGINIPESVTEIGEGTFHNCTSLQAIYLPEGITEIPAWCFSDCSNLREIAIAGDITSIGSTAFRNTALYGISLPKSLTLIDDVAFHGCNNLADVYYAGTATDWSKVIIDVYNDPLLNATIHFDETIDYPLTGVCGDSATWTLTEDGILTISGSGKLYDYYFSDGETAPWDYYRELVNAIVIEDGITDLGEYAFYYCENATSVSIPDSVISLGRNTFFRCSSLDNVVIPNHITQLEEGLFYGCESMSSIKIPYSVQTIESGVFWDCYALEELTIPSGVTTVAQSLVSQSGVKSLTIPKTVKSFGNYATYRCFELTDIYYEGSESEWNSIIIGSENTPLRNANIHYNCEMGCKHSVTNGAVIVDASCTEDGYYGEYCSDCGELVILETYLATGHIKDSGYIEKEATCTETGMMNFACVNCGANMGLAEIPAKGHNFVSGSCTNCGEKQSPSDVVASGSCGTSATWTLTADGTLTISGSGDMDSYNAVRAPWISYANQIKALVIEEGITSIGKYTFEYLTKLETAMLPETVNLIDCGAFRGCSSLKSIYLPAAIRNKYYTYHIQFDTFSGCNSLTDVYFGGSSMEWANVKVNPNGNSVLENVTVHYGYKPGEPAPSEWKGSFDNYTWLFKDGTLTISGSGWTNGFVSDTTQNQIPWFGLDIQHVILEEGVTMIGFNFFKDCTGIQSVSIPSTVTSIDTQAFRRTEVTDIYYAGSEEQWNAIRVGESNDGLLTANIHFGVVSETVVGDPNGDGEINSADVNLLYRAIMDYTELSNEQMSAADMNNDGKVNSADVNVLYRKVMGYL